ncbi:MAG: isoprenylcysteine carboxylmethyltransferase family protein [Planctomycetota bacterium]
MISESTKYKIGNIIFRLRPFFYLLIGAPMFFISWPASGGESANQYLTWFLGAGTLGLAAGLRIYSVRYLGEKSAKSRRLISINGPYQYVRNPLYIANLLGGVGGCIVFKLFWYIPICLLYIFLMHHLILIWYEEKRMAEKFGDAFIAYRNNVPRWWPAFKPVQLNNQETAPKNLTAWGKVFRGELGTLAAVGMTIILAWLKGQIS